MPYITCLCGKKFSLQYGDMAAICPDCGRTYYNEPGYHPQTVEEQDWKCSVCGKMNPRYVHGLLCVKCLYCAKHGTAHPSETCRENSSENKSNE